MPHQSVHGQTHDNSTIRSDLSTMAGQPPALALSQRGLAQKRGRGLGTSLIEVCTAWHACTRTTHRKGCRALTLMLTKRAITNTY